MTEGNRAEWPSPAYDRGRTGRTPATGAIREPKLAWHLDVSAREYHVLVTPERNAKGSCRLDPSLPLAPLDDDALCRWGLKAPPLFDVDGDGVPDVPPPSPLRRDLWANYLPGVKGMQRFSFYTGVNLKGLNISGRVKALENAWVMQMHSFEDGADKPRLLWTQPVHDQFNAQWIVPIAADCDGDGVREICVAQWHGVAIFDAETGEEKYSAYYRPNVRPYGYFGCYVDPERGPYLVNIGQKAGHVEALAVRDGELKVLWYHQFDPGDAVTLRRTKNEGPIDPIGDFNGDGRAEILQNTFNDFKDGRWYLLGYDLETGEHSIYLPDVHLWGHADIDGDGQEELLTQVCPRRARGAHGELRVYKGEKLIWTHPRARWSTFHPAYASFNRDELGGVGGGYAAVKARFDGDKGDTVFITVPDAQGETLQALRFEDGKAQVAWSISAPAGAQIQAAGARPDGVLVSVRAPVDEQVDLQSRDARLDAVALTTIKRSVRPLVLKDGNGQPLIVASDPLDQTTAWKVVGKAGRSLERLWRRPGRVDGGGISAADIDGDGVREVVAAREAPEGYGQMVAYGTDGVERWTHDLKDFDGVNHKYTINSGINLWSMGHFLDTNRWDLVVTAVRSIGQSQETGVINTEDGTVAWWGDQLLLDEGKADKHVGRLRGFGGDPTGQADYDGDGLDDIVLQHKSEHWIIKGTTGEVMTGHVTWPADALSSDYPGEQAIWGAPMLVADLDGDGEPESVVAYSWCIVAFKLDPHRRLQVLWHSAFEDGANNSIPAIADVNGDGKLELGVAGCNEGFRCMDAATGKTLWSVPAEGRASNTVGVDINGDGTEDFVFARGKRLMAVTQAGDGTGRIVWELDMPVEIGQIAVADWDGDGKAEVLASGTNGKLYGIE